MLRRCWGERFARSTHQRPAQIKEGLSHVVEGDLWRKVAEGGITAFMARSRSHEPRQHDIGTTIPECADEVRNRLCKGR
ncbi:hypothetical protein Mame01_07000 [Microbispora amethystogenes]|nr:hypothetical protein Mame01_07000 [Microbispora amethystogenes]